MRRLFLVHCLMLVALACVDSHTQTPAVGNSVSDPSVVQPLMKQFNVPGVSIAVIKDFKIAGDLRLRRRRCRDRRAGDGRDDVSGGVDQQAGGGDGVAEGGAERTVHARPGHQHHPQVMEGSGRAVHEGPSASRRAA